MPLKQRLEELFAYHPDGYLINIARRRGLRRAKAGYRAPDGYWRVCVDYKKYGAHQLIFLMHHGYLPDVIDHIDQDRGNNRIENLRAADKSSNSLNGKDYGHGSSGYRGVSYVKGWGKYFAYVTHKGKRHSFGFHATAEEAARARDMGAEKLFGEFLCKNI